MGSPTTWSYDAAGRLARKTDADGAQLNDENDGAERLPPPPFACYDSSMSTLTEIEAAAAALPLKQQRKLLEHLTAKLERLATKKAKPSLHERMKDFCGIVNSGIPDLATNKKHMEGFGRSRK